MSDAFSGDDPARPGTGEVTATVIVNAPAQRVFDAFLNWEKQSDWIPFTKVRVVEGDGGEGSLVEAVTALGPAVLRDELRVIKALRPSSIRSSPNDQARAESRALRSAVPAALPIRAASG